MNMNLNRFYLKYFTKQNMKHQLITLFICAIMVPVLIIGGIISFFTYRQMTSDYRNLTQSQARLVRSTMVSASIYLHSIYETVVNDATLQDLLCEDEPDFDTKEVSASQGDQFANIVANTAMLTGLHLYVPQELMQNVEMNKYISTITEDLKSSLWYQKSTVISGNFWISDIRIGQNGVQYQELYYCCRIPLPQKQTYAMLVMSVSNDYIRNLISNTNYQIYLTVNDDPVFFSSNRSYAGQAFPLDPKQEAFVSHSGTFDLFGKKTIGALEVSPLYQSEDTLYIFVADDNAFSTTHRLLGIFILIMLFAVLISAVIIFLYATYFSSRIHILQLAMYKVSKNDYEIVDTIQGDDELTATFHDMKIMITKLKAAEAEIYQSQIREQLIKNQQQQMELKLLANQINPHFLYNTLECIRMKAFSEGNPDVANSIKLLSKSMRYVLSNTRTTLTTLDKEIDYIYTYLTIQKMRFGSRINYQIQVDDSLDTTRYQILPILLQPIIENAIMHGLANANENGNIILRIRPSKDRTLLIAYIFDNGIGMSKEKLNEVRAHMLNPPQDSEHGIGLYNINNRIHLFYGESYGLFIRSKENFGTCITVTIPLYNITEED